MMLPTDLRRRVSREELKIMLQSRVRPFEKIKISNIVYQEIFNDSVFNAVDLEDVIFENCFLDCVRFSHSVFKNVLFEGCEIINGNFKNCQIDISCFQNCCMDYVDFSGSVLNCVNFKQNKSFSSNFRNSHFRFGKFKNCNLESSNFDLSELHDVEFKTSRLDNSSFKNVEFKNSYIIKCDLHLTDFSQSGGLLNPIDYMMENFEWNNDGIVVYKSFDHFLPQPPNWVNKKPGDILTEEANYDRTCLGCGMNVANKLWFKKQKETGIFDGVRHICLHDIWKCLIKFQWLPGVIVPYYPIGQIRCCRLQLIKKLSELETSNLFKGV